MLSPWEAVRQEAIKQLQSKPFGSYVPELLATLRTPVSARIQLLVGSGGVHLLERFSSETQWAHQVFDKRSSKYIVTRSNGGTGSVTGLERDRNRVARSTASAAVEAQLQARNSQKAADAQQEKTEEWNDRVCETLQEATGFQLSAEPQEWWSWWADYNQMTEEEKEYEYRCRENIDVETVEVDLPTVAPVTPLEPAAPPVTVVTPPRECLVAGTPIWTDRGAVAVEALQVGDLVLAKHPETGELKYQPVLRTTIREAEPIMKVTTPKGELRATGGHTFWISGRGWTKLRNAKPGQQFHGANGPVEIQSLESDGEEKTYNLLVANAAHLLRRAGTCAEPRCLDGRTRRCPHPRLREAITCVSQKSRSTWVAQTFLSVPLLFGVLIHGAPQFGGRVQNCRCFPDRLMRLLSISEILYKI